MEAGARRGGRGERVPAHGGWRGTQRRTCVHTLQVTVSNRMFFFPPGTQPTLAGLPGLEPHVRELEELPRPLTLSLF